jgi:hypothetical protein
MSQSLINTTGLTEEQNMMREGVLDLLSRHLPWEKVRQMDEAREFPHEAYNALAEAGYLGLFYPEALGGMGGSYKDIAVMLETLGYYYTGIAQAVTTSAIYAGMHVAKFGSPELKQEIVPKIISGQAKLALGMSEPGTGSDVAGIKTSAVRDGQDRHPGTPQRHQHDPGSDQDPRCDDPPVVHAGPTDQPRQRGVFRQRARARKLSVRRRRPSLEEHHELPGSRTPGAGRHFGWPLLQDHRVRARLCA